MALARPLLRTLIISSKAAIVCQHACPALFFKTRVVPFHSTAPRSVPFFTRKVAPKSTLEEELRAIEFKRNSGRILNKIDNLSGAQRLGAFLVAWAILVGLYYGIEQNKNASFVTCKLLAKETVSDTSSIFCLDGSAPDIKSVFRPQGSSPLPRSPLSPPTPEADLFNAYLRVRWKRDAALNFQHAWETGIGVWNVQFKQPQLQIVRRYTPLPPSWVTDEHGIEEGEKEKEKGCLKFLIRHDGFGEVSNYLHRLYLGTDIDVRGPYLEYRLVPDTREVVFFAGGTGIAPALQVAHCLFESENNREHNGTSLQGRKLHILWANRTRGDCLGGVNDEPPAMPLPPPPPPKSTWSDFFTRFRAEPTSAAPATTVLEKPVATPEKKGPIVRELEALKRKYPGQVTVEYFVDEENTWIDEDAVSKALSRFDDKDASRAGQPTSADQRQILVSGPDGFIAYLAGPKRWVGGKERQGPVGGAVARALQKEPHSVKVWKI